MRQVGKRVMWVRVGRSAVTERHSPRPFVFHVARVYALCAIVIYVVGLYEFIANPMLPTPFGQGGLTSSVTFRALSLFVVSPSVVAIAALVIRRAPGNVTGYLMLIWGASRGGLGVSVESDPWVQAGVAASFGVVWTALFFIPAYFPNGRPAQRWFAPILNFSWVYSLFYGIALITLDPYLGGLGRLVANPAYAADGRLAQVVINIYGPLGLCGILIALFSPLLRYRGGTARERLQLKWILFGAACLLPLFFIYASITDNLGAPSRQTAWSESFFFFYYLFVDIFPVAAVGNAILRYRLWDIDIIIRRTLIYAVLTGILAAVYFGGIILTQQLFRAATGESSDLAIVVSTLLIAALFTPIRRRVQDVIDRRLYRRKYDVEQTLTDFQKNLREDVDMETLKANLVGVVNDTMQPSSVRLWVRDNRS